MTLNRDALLARAARRYANVPVDGGEVRLQSITELERSKLQAGNFRRGKDGLELDSEKLAGHPARLLSLCVVDDNGQPMLTPAEASSLDSAIATVLVLAARKHCGLDEEEDEGAEKNSEGTGG